MAKKEEFSKECIELIDKVNNINDIDVLTKEIILQARSLANAQGCVFFEVDANKVMQLKYMDFKGLTDVQIRRVASLFETVLLSDANNKVLKSSFELCALNNQIINTDNVYAEKNVDTSHIAKFDEENNFATVSVLTVPISGSNGSVIGVAEFINSQDDNGKTINFIPEVRNNIISVCKMLSCPLENKNLRRSYSQLLESFIEIWAKAIDTKSHYTGEHCQRVPIIVKMLASAAVEDQKSSLKNFSMSDDDWYSLHIASWLHDCGKITTPEYIVDKATKLETVTNRIHEIRTRFEILRRDAHIAYLQKRLANIDSKENLQAEFVTEVKKLEDDFAFVASCNIGDDPIGEEEIKRLEQIGKKSFVRYFNRMLGLSWAEKNAIENSEPYTHPAEETLLQDRPDHIDGLNNKGELYNLKVKQGTINFEERKKINEHIEVTIDMLKAIPLPKELSSVIEIAGCHHEWVNGQGYPHGLTGDQMSIQAKIVAIADVFEALTARDRPYKKPKKLSEVLQIMQEMKNIGHLDPDLYRVFIEKGVYMDYAKQYMEKEQIDNFNPMEML
ncbi:MAG: HD domain-containing protein [Alphaproteobacteria bacterium]|nr:HD domain-containing protein [Alphaproteobacteria bacterium]